MHNAFLPLMNHQLALMPSFIICLPAIEISLVERKEGKRPFPLMDCLGAHLSYLFFPALAFYVEYSSPSNVSWGGVKSPLPASCSSVSRIALNWGKQPVVVVNLPSDRLLRRAAQVRRECRLSSTASLPSAGGGALLSARPACWPRHDGRAAACSAVPCSGVAQ